MSILSETTFLFDIETSGLSRENDQIISIGVLYQQKGQLKTDYHFITGPEEEKKVLEAFLTWCQSFETIVTFRGKGFDYPFLLARLQLHQLPDAAFLKLKLIDTEKYLKVFSSNRKELEQKLQFIRHSTSTGQDVAHLYRTYVSCQDPLYKKLILDHQEDELKSLYGIWELYQMLYHIKSAHVFTQEASGRQLHVSFQYPEAFMYSFNEKAYNIQFYYQAHDSILHLTIPLLTASLKHALSPVKDYYYVESQHQLIHKSLAAFIPADQKRKAKKEECYISEQHTFIQIYSSHQLDHVIWYDDHQHQYVIWDTNSANILAQQIFFLFFQSTQKKGIASTQ